MYAKIYRYKTIKEFKNAEKLALKGKRLQELIKEFNNVLYGKVKKYIEEDFKIIINK